ncbi:MAG: NAD-dependent succinate-semialdehyde dehydrogenase [Bernardetiaceae bacterium]
MIFETHNPATQAVIEQYHFQTKTELFQSLEQAHLAQQHWRTLAVAERVAAVEKLAQVTATQAENLARLVTQEMGKPIREARAELQKCISLCRFYAERAEDFLSPETIPTANAKSYVRFDPVGVILGIMPWNFPFWQVYRYAIPALLAGNTTLLKHAPNTTGCALRIGELFTEADFPEGVLTVILAHTDDIPALIQDTRIQGVTLTGSERAGAAVAEQAGRALKKTVLELGGSDPFIVLPDADIAAAARAGAQARYMNTGQSCIAAKRFLVHAAVLEDFKEKFYAATQALIVGDPAEETTQIGCLARPDLADQLEGQLQASIAKGAQLLWGGIRQGNFFTPALLTDITPEMPAYKEEFFGPVALLFSFETEAEMIALTNATDYGLGASIWTANTAHAEIIAEQIASGSVFINQITRSDSALPFGGIKRSGYGRELSHWGIREFTNIKTVVVA